jgi:hypothetical protein
MNNIERPAGTADENSTIDEANNVKPKLQQCNVSGSTFIVKVDDTFCEWEYGFTIDRRCIDDFIKAIEKSMGVKRDYERLSRDCL